MKLDRLEIGFLCGFIGLLVGLFLGAIERERYTRHAIQSGHAIYNPTNGALMWKEDEVQHGMKWTTNAVIEITNLSGRTITVQMPGAKENK